MPSMSFGSFASKILRLHPRQNGVSDTPQYPPTAVDRYGVEDLSNYDAEGIFASERFRVLERNEQYFNCTQHDHKAYDWNGNMKPRGIVGVQAMTSARATSNDYIPLDSRRPLNPYRLGRKIVTSFTGLIFGGPVSYTSHDPDTQDFAEELYRRALFVSRQNEARNKGGACGSVALIWRYVNGMPRVRVQTGKYIHILEWEDPEIYTVRHATELYQTVISVYDEKAKKRIPKAHWVRKDWTHKADIVFEPKAVDSKDPNWHIDEEETVVHDDGYAHLIWIPNTPPAEPGNYDGQPDYFGTTDQLDSLDITNSVTTFGTNMNLDPTLLLKMDQDDMGTVLKKGSTNALCVGMQGDGRYLELAGTAVTAGLSLIAETRRQALETASCVVPDENAVTGAGVSSLTLKVLYAPMTNQANVYRGQYGPAFERLMNQMLNSARRLMGLLDEVTEEAQGNAEEGVEQGEVVHDELEQEDSENVHVLAQDAMAKEQLQGYEGEHEQEFEEEPVSEEIHQGKMQRAYYVDLEPRIEKRAKLDDEGNVTGEEEIIEIPRTPGSGSITLVWPEFFPKTLDDEQKETTSASQAVGAKALISQQTAVERYATSHGLDPAIEWGRVQAEQKRQQDLLSDGMFPDAGGRVDNMDDAPDGVPAGGAVSAEIAQDKQKSSEERSELEAQGIAPIRVPHVEGEPMLTSTDLATVIFVNEARAQVGLGPMTNMDGSMNPDGFLTVAAYKKKLELLEELQKQKDEQQGTVEEPNPFEEEPS